MWGCDSHCIEDAWHTLNPNSSRRGQLAPILLLFDCEACLQDLAARDGKHTVQAADTGFKVPHGLRCFLVYNADVGEAGLDLKTSCSRQYACITACSAAAALNPATAPPYSHCGT